MARLLIVEDEKITRENLHFYYDWCSVGIERVETADNGRTAIEVLKGYTPDIIITDIKMPFLDGIQLAEILEKQNKDCIIIVISAYTETEYFKKAIKLKVFDYILKPINRDELMTTVQNAINYLDHRSEYREVVKQINKTPLISPTNKDGTPLLHETAKGQEPLIVKRIKELIDQNYMLSGFSINTLATQLNYTSSYICMVFKKHTNQTINDYITYIRIENSKKLLTDVTLKLYDISNLLGFSDENYFSKVFKKYVGVTPAAYRKGGGI